MAGKAKKLIKEKVKKEQKSTWSFDEEDINDIEFWMGFGSTFALSLILYSMTAYPGLPIGDSGEFMSTSIDFGVSHPPGYPLFTILSYFSINYLPFGTPAWRINILSVIFGTFFNTCIYYLVTVLGSKPAVGFLSAGWIGFSRLLWMWSIQGEIFTLNNLFCVLIMIQAYKYEGSHDKILEAKRSAFLCGLSLSNQHTSVLFIIPFAIRVAYIAIIRERGSFYDILKISLFGVLGMLWYIQLPISYYFFTPRVTWGEFNSVSNLVRHMLRLDYGSSFKLVAGESKSSFLANFIVFVRDSSLELSIIPWLLVIVLFAVLYKHLPGLTKNSLSMVTFMLLSYFIVFCSLANIDDLRGLNMGVLERFWMQPFVGLIVLSGVSLSLLLSYISRKGFPSVDNRYMWWLLAVALVSYQIRRNYDDNNESDNMYSYHYAMAVLPHLPANALMLTGGDLPTNVFRYHTICEGIRPDVKVLDMQFMAADWYHNVLAPTTFAGVEIPGVYRPFTDPSKLHKNQYNVEIFLNMNIDKYPIFICNGFSNKDESYKKNFVMIPFQTCFQFHRRSNVQDLIQMVSKTPNVTMFEWPMPNGFQYEDRSWEYTLLTTYIGSLVKKGIMIWEEATLLKSNSPAQRYLIENGLQYMKEATAQLEKAIEDMKVPEGIWSLTSESFAKNLGNYCMIYHSMVELSSDSDKEEVLPQLETCVRKYWRLHTRWVPDAKADPFIKEINRVLALETIRGLRYDI